MLQAKYDAEMALARAALAAKEADGGGGARLTGKAYFRSLAAGEKEEGGDVEEDEEVRVLGCLFACACNLGAGASAVGDAGATALRRLFCRGRGPSPGDRNIH